MEEQNPVYIKLEYSESIDSQRGILSSEMSLINILKAIKRYNFLRDKELVFKARLHKTAKELGVAARKTKASFPFLKIPEKAKASEIKKIEMPREENPQEKKEEVVDELELQLRDIQDKLRNLG